MKLYNHLINKFPFLIGTWILRSTNDKYLNNGYTFLILNDDNSIKLKTNYQEGIVGVTKSRSGSIENILNNTNITNLKINYTSYNKFSHSIFGVEIPKINHEYIEYKISKDLNIQIIDKTMLITDIDLPLYYLFDLQIGNVKSPFIETQIHTLIFSQFVSFFLNLILANIIHLILKDLYL